LAWRPLAFALALSVVAVHRSGRGARNRVARDTERNAAARPPAVYRWQREGDVPRGPGRAEAPTARGARPRPPHRTVTAFLFCDRR
jgi:hypothetical protein